MINYGKHFIDQSDINSVIKVLRSNKITQGPYVELFESKLKIILFEIFSSSK